MKEVGPLGIRAFHCRAGDELGPSAVGGERTDGLNPLSVWLGIRSGVSPRLR